MPVWVILGHDALYVAVGFVWLFFTDDGMMDEEAVARRDDRLYGYQLAAMLCFLIFADNGLRLCARAIVESESSGPPGIP